MRGAAITAVGLAIVMAAGTALFASWHGRIRFWEPGSGQVVLFVMAIGFGVVASIRAHRRSEVTEQSAVQCFGARCSLPQVVGLGVLGAGFVAGLVTGWWIVPLIGGVAMLVGVGLGAPTRERVAEAERDAQATGESVIEQLLTADH